MTNLISEFEESTFATRLDIIDWECFPISSYMICESEENPDKLYKKVWDALLEFIKKIKNTIQDAITSGVKKAKRIFESKETKDKLVKLKKEIQNAEAKGIRTVDFYDVWRYQSVMERSVKELDFLTSAYLKKYNFIGAGLTETNHFTKKVKDTIDKYESELKKIKEKKIKVSSKKVLEWIDSQTRKGNTNIFSFAEDYVHQLDKYEKMVREYERRADDYAKKTGMVRKPEGFTDTMKNISVYVKRNMDWIGFALASAGLHFVKSAANVVATNAEYNSMNDKDAFRGDSMIRGDKKMKDIAANNVKDGTYHDKANKKFITATRVTNAGQVISGAKVGENLLNSVANRRNSV